MHGKIDVPGRIMLNRGAMHIGKVDLRPILQKPSDLFNDVNRIHLGGMSSD
jgi:hypothetical protein